MRRMSMQPETTEEELRRAQELAGCRVADDRFCQLCGKRGVWGIFCTECSDGLNRPADGL